VLPAIADEAAQRFGDTPAFITSAGWPVSYRDLAQRSQEVAAALVHRGIGEGDVVALVLPSIPEYVIAYLAAARLGAITTGVNARLTPEERTTVLGIAGPRLVIATADLAPDRPIGEAEVVTIEPATASDDLFGAWRERGNWVDPLPDDPDRPVAIVFTSGTTGVPKGAVFANRQLDFITLVDTGRRWGGGVAQLAGTSFAHLGPMTKLPGTLLRGGTTYLVDRWRAAEALAMIETHRLSSVGGIPTQLALMLRDPSFDDRDLSCVRAIVIGGGPATPSLVREARERLGAPLAVRYSCTEAGIGLGTAFDAPPEDAELTVGRPHDGVELTIIDDEGTPLAAGEIGEVCLRSPAVMTGYWRDRDATRDAFTTDGSVRTGDLGFVDEAGRLRLVGRRKELYIRGGYNVYPVEVEAVLATHPAVADVAIVPRPDDVMGEIGVAVVVPTDNQDPPTLEALREHAERHLAKHKLPEHLMVVESLPLTPMEKVDRRALQALVTEDVEKER
jgi:acyl-CoA synthetase (AMP-forming)/AMP-acid ligase II